MLYQQTGVAEKVVVLQALPGQSTPEGVPSFKLVLVGDGGTGTERRNRGFTGSSHCVECCHGLTCLALPACKAWNEYPSDWASAGARSDRQ